MGNLCFLLALCIQRETPSQSQLHTHKQPSSSSGTMSMTLQSNIIRAAEPFASRHQHNEFLLKAFLPIHPSSRSPHSVRAQKRVPPSVLIHKIYLIEFNNLFVFHLLFSPLTDLEEPTP